MMKALKGVTLESCFVHGMFLFGCWKAAQALIHWAAGVLS